MLGEVRYGLRRYYVSHGRSYVVRIAPVKIGVARYNLGTYGYDWEGRVWCEEVQLRLRVTRYDLGRMVMIGKL